MRAILLLLALIFLSFAESTAQIRPDLIEINYSAVNKPIKEAIREISALSGVSIAYSEHRLPSDHKVNVAAINERLGDVLKTILNNVGLDYQLIGNQIVIKASQELLSNEQFTLYGYIRDAHSGESLIGANVYVPDKSLGTASNHSGFYSIKLKGGIQRLHYSYLGYKTAIAEFNLFQDTVINVRIKPDGRLNEIVILENYLEQGHETSGEIQHLHLDKIYSAYHPGGDSDVFRYLHSLPGVSTGADGIGGISVRGGSPDQNLMLVDGVPVYNPSHALGILSSFNTSVIKNVSFIKGGVPARYSGRISSVLDIHTRDGNQHRLAGEFSISPLVLKASLEGPLAGKGSFLLSYRNTLTALWLNQLIGSNLVNNNTLKKLGYNFQDLNAKLSINFNEKNKLQIHLYGGNDNFISQTEYTTINTSDTEQNKLKWGNRMASAKWTSELSGTVYSRMTLYHTSYTSNRYYNNQFIRNETGQGAGVLRAGVFNTDINENGLMWDVDWMMNNRHLIRTGVAYRHRRLQPFSYHLAGNPFINPELNQTATESNINNTFSSIRNFSGELSTYLEDEFSLSRNVKVNGGLHGTYITNYNSNSTLSLQPRISILLGNEYFHVKSGASRMFQPLHLITNSGIGLPSEIWVGWDKGLSGAESWMFNTGFGIRNRRGYKVGLDLYYRSFQNLLSDSDGIDTPIYNGIQWKGNLVTGDGNAYGMECYFEKMNGTHIFNINYSFSISDRQFNLLNNGRNFPYQLNRLHNFKLSYTYRFSGFAELLVNWNLASGNYYTSPGNISILTDNDFALLYTEKNNSLFEPYHRLDVGVCYYKSYSWGNSKFFAGIYNVYNRRNSFYTDLKRSTDNPEKLELNQLSLIPVWPAISYSISW